MHDLLRLYADRLPVPDSDREAARTQLLDHYQTIAEQAAAHVAPAVAGDFATNVFASRDSALAWLDAELDNLTATITAEPTSNHHRELAHNLPLTLARYLDRRRHLNQWIALTTIALRHARYFTDRHGEGRALNNLGSALAEVRRFGEAIDAHQQAAQISRETGDRDGEGKALNNLGLALWEVRRFGEAIETHQQVIAICRETGDRDGEGRALNNLGLTLTEVRKFGEAIDAHQQAAAIYRETSNRHREGRALNNLGAALRKRGRLIKARRAFARARELLSEFGE